MSQQINLYDEAFRAQKKPFSAATMAGALAVIAGTFLLLHVYLVSQVHAIEQALTGSDKALADMRSQLAFLASRNAVQGGGQALVDELARAEARLRTRQELLRDITTRVAADAQGYSGLMEGLARRTTRGLWLIGFTVRETRDLEIKGRVLDAKLVPSYMQSLSEEAFARGRTVTELTLKAGESAPKPAPGLSKGDTRPDAALRYVEFAVTFAPRDAPAAEAAK